MPVLSPAYGRVYQSASAVHKDFLEGKDFLGDIMVDFRLCSVRDFPGQKIELRYGKHLEKCMLTTAPYKEER